MSASTFDVKAAQLEALTVSGGLFQGGKIALYTNPQVPVQSSQLSDFTLATFAGSTPKSVGTYSAPFTDADGVIQIAPPGVVFQPTDSMLAETIYGWIVTDSGGTTFLYGNQLTTPVVLATPEDGLLVEAAYPYGA